MSSVKETVSSFIKAHAPADRLVVCTGYVSVKGLAWIARQVPPSQSVTIIIGDMRPINLAKATDEDRRVAAQFLRQGNVEVHTWFRTKPVKKMAHGKVVVAIHNGRVLAALVGSANLTETGLADNLETGLADNLEIMVPCAAEGLPSMMEYITEATRHESAKDKLLDAVAPGRGSTAEKQPARSGGGGYAPVLVTLPFRAIARLFSPAHPTKRDQPDR